MSWWWWCLNFLYIYKDFKHHHHQETLGFQGVSPGSGGGGSGVDGESLCALGLAVASRFFGERWKEEARLMRRPRATAAVDARAATSCAVAAAALRSLCRITATRLRMP